MLYVICNPDVVKVEKSFFKALKYCAEIIQHEEMMERMFGLKKLYWIRICVVNDEGNIIKEIILEDKAV